MLEGGGDDPHVVGFDVLAPALKQLPRLGVESVERPVGQVGRGGYADVTEKDRHDSYDYDYVKCTDLGG